ncbi:hypothetical protein HDU89_001732 [Geranomyces variabilis]|nr:hypothetical protein HDU89_001732 [Geranomyces variabilis]
MSFNTIETTSSTPSSTSITPGSPPGAAQPGDFIGRWRVERTIGQGTYGKVRLAIDPLTLEKVAVKVIEKSQVQSNKQIARLQREIRFLRLLHHPHIVKVYEVLETDAFIHIIMEFASGGELFDYIVAHKRNAVIHRDLKPENLLLDETKTIKIIDFGFGNNFTVEGLLDTFCGSPFYAAPEMILGKKYEGPEVDMWSLGVILFALLCGHLPFDDENMKELYRKIANGSYTCPDHLLPSARHLISRLITVDPKRRATLAEVLSHSWVNDGYDGPPPNYLPERPVIRDTAQLSPTILERLYVFGYTPADVERAFGNSGGGGGGGGKPDDRRETDPSPVRATYFLLAEMLAREQARATTTNAGGSRRGSLAFGSLGALSGPGGGAGGIASHASTSSLTRCASASMPNVSSSVTIPGAAVVGNNANNSIHHNAPPPRLAAATGPGAAAHAPHVPESQYAAGLMTLFGGNDRRASSPDARIARPPSHRGFVGGGLHPHHPGQHHLSPPPPMPGALGADVANVQPPPNAKIRGQSSKVGPASPATTSSSSSGGGGSGGSSSLWATARSKPPTIPLPPTPTALSPVATVGPPPKEPSWLRRFSIPTVPSAHRHQQPVVAPTREVQSATIGGSPYIPSPTSPHPPPPATMLASSSSSSSPPLPTSSADNTRRRGSLASVVTNTSSAAQLLLPGSTRIREELRAVSGWLFNVSTTTTKPVSEVMAQLVEILARHGVSYSIDDPNHIVNVNERGSGGGGGGSHGGAGAQSVQGGPYGSDETHAVFCEADVSIAQDPSASASAAVIPAAADATTHLFRSSSASRRQSIHGSGVTPAYAYSSASQPQFLTRSASVSSSSSAAATTTNPKSPSSRTLGASSSSNNNENNGAARGGGGGGGSNGSLTESTASSSSSSSAYAQKQPQPKHAPHNNDNTVPPAVSSQHPKHKPRKTSLHTQHQYHSQPTALATPPSREKHHWRNHHHHHHNYNHHHDTQNQQQKQTVSFQITVSRLARVNHLTGVHFKRLHGGVWTYKKICNKLLAQMSL